jgi:hypothetical protein
MRLTFPEGEEIRWFQRPFATKYPDGMAEYLDATSTGGDADETTGTTEWVFHVSRFGKRLLFSDDQGFVWVEKHATEAEAIAEFEDHDAAYGEWLDVNGED